jgi:hypothetical protein
LRERVSFSVLSKERKRAFDRRIRASEVGADEALVAQLKSSHYVSPRFGPDCVQSRENLARGLSRFSARYDAAFRRHSKTRCKTLQKNDSSDIDRHTPNTLTTVAAMNGIKARLV